jgi:hypothetical protein
VTVDSTDKGWVSAEDLMKELESDPDYLARQAQDDARRARRDAELAVAEKPLLEELRTVGCNVESAWDLVNKDDPYPKVLPILLEHLSRPYPDRVREGIARALAVRDARFAWGTLKELYEAEPAGTDTKDGLAVALAAMSDDDNLAELVDLVDDAAHGESRVLLLRAFSRAGDPRARPALEKWTADSQLAEEARRILSRT